MKFAYLIEPPFNFRDERGAITGCDVELAKRVVERTDVVVEWVDDLFVRLFAAVPTDAERQMCFEFLDRQQAEFADSERPEEQALATLCQTLFASTRFLYVR